MSYPNYWIYTGSTKQEALQKCDTAKAIVNAGMQALCGEDWAMWSEELTAEPVIENITYYYGFQQPPEQVRGTATCDLDTQYDRSWIIIEEEEL